MTIVPPELGDLGLDGFNAALPWCITHRCSLAWWLPGGRITLLCPLGGERHLVEVDRRAYQPVAQPDRWALTWRLDRDA